MIENRQQRRARERAERKSLYMPMQPKQRACYLDTVTYYIEFSIEPSADIVQKIVQAVSRPTDRVKWSIGDEPDFYMLENSNSLLQIDIDVRPCRESGGFEGTLSDLDLEQDADDETPQELIDRLREAKTTAAKYGGQLTDGYYESELTSSPMTWEELDD